MSTPERDVPFTGSPLAKLFSMAVHLSVPYKQISKVDAPMDRKTALQETMFAGRYSSPFLHELINKDSGAAADDLESLKHLNCSFLSNSSGTVPSLLQIKQHTQAFARVIKDLDGSDPQVKDDNPFDYLADLENPYVNDSQAHNIPLKRLVNSVGESAKEPQRRKRTTKTCPLHVPVSRDVKLLVDHANEILEALNAIPADEDGLPTTPTPRGGTVAKIPNDTHSKQWFTTYARLTSRFNELEEEVSRCHEVIAGEAFVPLQGTPSTKKRDNNCPPSSPTSNLAQHQFVLTNISEDLCLYLSHELSLKEAEMRLNRAHRRHPARQPITAQNLRDLDAARLLASIDIQCRLHRLAGSDKIFIDLGQNIKNVTESVEPSKLQVVATPTRLKRKVESRAKRRGEFDEKEKLEAKMQEVKTKLANQRVQQKQLEAELRELRSNLNEQRSEKRLKVMK